MLLASIRNNPSIRIIPKGLSFFSSNTKQLSSVYRRQLSKNLIPLNSAEGKRLFQESLREKNCESFFTLIQHFNSQTQISTCASATLSMILNSLKIDPGKNWKGIWRWYDDYNIKEMPQSKLYEGLTLEEFHDLAIKNSAKSMTFSPINDEQQRGNNLLKKSSLNLFRNCLISCHRRTNMLMTINFSRKSLSQTGSGHYSPLAAYNSRKDMALVLDVAKFKYDSYWCSVEQIYKSLKEIDPKSNQPRGFLINKKNYQGQQQPQSSLCTLEVDTQTNTFLHKNFNNFVEQKQTNIIDFFIHLLNTNSIHMLLISILYEFYTTDMQNRSQILQKIALQSNLSYLAQISIVKKLAKESQILIQAFTQKKKEDTLLFLGLVLFSNLKNQKPQNIPSELQHQYKKTIKLIIKCQRSLQNVHQLLLKQ